MIMSDNLLNVIENITTDGVVKSIINSENARQHACKDWLVEQTEDYIGLKEKFTVCIAAGWYGLLAYKLRQKYASRITKLTSFDRDKQCSNIGHQMYPNNKIDFEWNTIENFNPNKYDVIVSTSCEHVSDKTINEFISRKQPNTVVVLQSNNYFSRSDHLNCKNSLDEFADSINLKIIDQQELPTDAYTRYMIVGR